MADSFFLDTRGPGANERLTPLMAALNHQDPLPCALLCAAYVDKCLLGILEQIFIKGSNTAKNLLKPDWGLIGSLQNRANIVYLLGHISPTTLENIGHICTVRNLFAHSHEPLTFESPKVAEWCARLKPWVPVITINDMPGEQLEQVNASLRKPRSMFVTTVMNTISELILVGVKLTEKPPNQ
jgi:hypothetical protein